MNEIRFRLCDGDALVCKIADGELVELAWAWDGELDELEVIEPAGWANAIRLARLVAVEVEVR